MADVSTPAVPGNLTVPPLFGWEILLVLLAVLVVVGLVVAVVGTARAGATGRSEWQAYLDARSTRAPAPEEALPLPGARELPTRGAPAG